MSNQYTIFIDDSKGQDPPANVLAALIVPNALLPVVEARWTAFRAWLLETYELPLEQELNGSTLLRGGYKKYGIYRIQGAEAYRLALRALAQVEGIGVMGCVFRGHMNFQKRTFQFLGERLESTMFYRDAYATVFCDHGASSVGLFERLKRENEVKARGFRAGGKFADRSQRKVIRWTHLETFIPADSKHEWGIQAADFLAFACLRTEYPTQRLAEHGLAAPWKLVEPLWIREVTTDANDAIVRKPRHQ